MKINITLGIILANLTLITSLSARAVELDLTAPDLGARYATLQQNYGKDGEAVQVSDLKPLSQFSTQYAGCYWVLKNTAGEYIDDIFAVGLADYHLIIADKVPADPGKGPLFPPQPGTPTIEKDWRGPAVVFGMTYFPDDSVILSGLGETDFPKVGQSDDEKAMTLTRTTNIEGNGEAIETQYLRKHSDGSLATKTVFTMAGKTAFGYGYCWRPAKSIYMP